MKRLRAVSATATQVATLEGVFGITQPAIQAAEYDLAQIATVQAEGVELAQLRCHSVALFLEHGTPLPQSVRTWAVAALKSIAAGVDAGEALGTKARPGRPLAAERILQHRNVALLVQQLRDQGLGKAAALEEAVRAIEHGPRKLFGDPIGKDQVERLYKAQLHVLRAARTGSSNRRI